MTELLQLVEKMNDIALEMGAIIATDVQDPVERFHLETEMDGFCKFALHNLRTSIENLNTKDNLTHNTG